MNQETFKEIYLCAMQQSAIVHDMWKTNSATYQDCKEVALRAAKAILEYIKNK